MNFLVDMNTVDWFALISGIALLYVVERCTAPDADAEMQEVMGMVRSQLHDIAPTIFPSE